jgi:hypothetical protein
MKLRVTTTTEIGTMPYLALQGEVDTVLEADPGWQVVHTAHKLAVLRHIDGTEIRVEIVE